MTPDRRSDAVTRSRVDRMQEEYRALAERNWKRINETHESYRRFNAWAKMLLAALVVVQIVLAALTVSLISANGARIRDIQQGRRTGSQITCSVLSGVTEAGRLVITAGSRGTDTPFTRFLERHGYPPLAVRRAQADQSASVYVETIARHIQTALHSRRMVPLINHNGSIDCAAFLRLVRVAR